MRYGILPYDQVRNLRNDKNLTQSYIAKMLNISQNTYSQYEIGTLKYPVEVLIKLAVFYGTSVDYLVSLTDVPEPYKRKKKESL